METLEYMLTTATRAEQWIPHPKFVTDLAPGVPLEVLAVGLLVFLVGVILLYRR